MIRGFEATGHQVEAAAVCSNCKRGDKVVKLPVNLCYSDWHLMEHTSIKLTTEIHISHTGCANQEGWRRSTGEAGWPRFIAILHERYAPFQITLKCEGCETTIRHSTISSTPVEDY